MTRLGYPVYFARILGVWEVLAGIALLVPRFARLKEWAYAGIFFNMTGAAASRAVRGDDVSHIVAPLAFAGLTIASWALRPQSRTLGVLSPPRSERRRQTMGAARRIQQMQCCTAQDRSAGRCWRIVATGERDASAFSQGRDRRENRGF
jgi:hypothetical protein